MIHYSNITRYDNMPFDQYLQLPGYSHSFLKRERNGVCEDLTITDNIRIGSLVDAILTDPEKVDMSSPLYPYARDIAAKIRASFGPMIQRFQKQVSFTAEASYLDFTMPVTGRLDFMLPGYAVIDLKVTKSKDMKGLIDHMGYKNQGWNYCKMAGVGLFYLMIHSIPLKKTELIKIDCRSDDNGFWMDKILKFGKVNAY